MGVGAKGLSVKFQSLKALFHSSQNPTRNLAERAFIQSQYMIELAASLQVGCYDEWKRGVRALFTHRIGASVAKWSNPSSVFSM